VSRRRAFKALRQPKPPRARGNRQALLAPSAALVAARSATPPPRKVGALAKRVFDRTPQLIVEKA
jgi:hypothetical protein